MAGGSWCCRASPIAASLGLAKSPSRSGDLLEWGIEKQIFHSVGEGVRCHSLIQQHLVNTSEGAE